MTSIVFPEISSDFEIDPNCFYNIRVLGETGENEYFSINNFKVNKGNRYMINVPTPITNFIFAGLIPSRKPDVYQILSIVLVCSISFLTLLYLSYKGVPFIKTLFKYYEDTTSEGSVRWISSDADILITVRTVDMPLYNVIIIDFFIESNKKHLIIYVKSCQF